MRILSGNERKNDFGQRFGHSVTDKFVKDEDFDVRYEMANTEG